jgi:hypothetical protein
MPPSAVLATGVAEAPPALTRPRALTALPPPLGGGAPQGRKGALPLSAQNAILKIISLQGNPPISR